MFVSVEVAKVANVVGARDVVAVICSASAFVFVGVVRSVGRPSPAVSARSARAAAALYRVASASPTVLRVLGAGSPAALAASRFAVTNKRFVAPVYRVGSRVGASIAALVSEAVVGRRRLRRTFASVARRVTGATCS